MKVNPRSLLLRETELEWRFGISFLLPVVVKMFCSKSRLNPQSKL